MYKNTYETPFHSLPNELKWNEYTDPQVYLDLSRWKIDRGWKSQLDCVMRWMQKRGMEAKEGYIDVTYAIRHGKTKKAYEYK